METVENWKELTWEQKREERFKKWLEAPGVTFNSPETKEKYRARVTRFIKAIKLEEPDRVPVIHPAGYIAASYAGYNLGEVMYDYRKLADAWLKFMRDFGDMDTFGGTLDIRWMWSCWMFSSTTSHPSWPENTWIQFFTSWPTSPVNTRCRYLGTHTLWYWHYV